MLASFQDYIEKEKLFTKRDKILLAVSGGVDSMLMLDLFQKSNYAFAVAHGNFQLRGEESDGDEQFVKDICTLHQIPFYGNRFNTTNFSKKQGISIQMAARDLRHEWFQTLAKENNYQFIALAHHQDDHVETVLINLTRGTGIKGLHGILPKKGNLIRPLLFSNRKQIERYAKENNIAFREDSSNVSDKYIRNKIRHQVLPVLKEINPDLNQTFENNSKRFLAAEKLLAELVKEKWNAIAKEKGEAIHIDINVLKKRNDLSTFLYEALKLYGFNEDHILNICNALDAESGKVFYSPTHQLQKDRTILILEKIQKEKEKKVLIDAQVKTIKEPLNIQFSIAAIAASFQTKRNTKTALLDLEQLQFPLILRKWQAGDHFQPLGMVKKKKLSNFLIDEKVPLFEKENTYVLTSGNDIVWVVGKRIDDRYKITDASNRAYICELQE